MPRFLRDRLFLAWAVLVAVTLVSAQIGGPSPGIRLTSAAAISLSVLGIAFAKVAVVMFAFMEVGHAPRALQLLCALWLCVVLGALLALYFGVLPIPRS